MIRVVIINFCYWLCHLKLLEAQDVNTVDPLFQNYDENLFEGDIIPTYESIADFYGEDLAIQLGLEPMDENASRGPDGRLTRHWKVFVNPSNGKYYVPYSFGIGSGGAYTSEQEQFIADTFQDLADATGVIDFIPRTTETEYVVIQNDGGCSSFIGRVGRFFSGGIQTMNIGWCVDAPASIQHEMMHALGFYHEQSRNDRDEYVNIHEDNIQEEAIFNFDKASAVDSLESPYDYCSVMHYSPSAFATSWFLITISLQDGQDGCTDPQFSSFFFPFGQRIGVSDLDVQQIRQVYQCSDGISRTLTEFQADLCTDTCKCWEGASGCDSDNQCIGDLVCSNQVCRQFEDTESPTSLPSSIPSITPSILPSISPTDLSSAAPSLLPTLSAAPSQMPSLFPSFIPSTVPSQFPSLSPSSMPSIAPTSIPSLKPSLSNAPTLSSNEPSNLPTNTPSVVISDVPSSAPSRVIFIPFEPVPCRNKIFTALLKRIIDVPDED